MSDFRVPMGEVNIHPDNQRLSWHVMVPPVAEPGNIQIDVGAVDALAAAGHVDRVFVLPNDAVRLGALAHSGFDSHCGVDGADIAEQALEAPGKWFLIRDESVQPPVMHAGLKLDVGQTWQKLRAKSAEGQPDRWARKFNRELGIGLGYAALNSIYSQTADRVLSGGRAFLGIFKVVGAVWTNGQFVRATRTVFPD